MGKCNFRVSVNLVLQKDDTVCLMRRYNTGWNDGNYALMGGHVEDGENPSDAAVREAKEELGITVNSNNLSHLLTMSVNPDHIYLYFGCSEYQGEITNMEPNECDDIRFFNVNELPDNIIGADKMALSYIFGEQNIKYQAFGYDDNSQVQ